MEELGGRILRSSELIFEDWLKLKKIGGSGVNRVLRVYGRFMVDVLNKKDEGEEMLSRLQNIGGGGESINESMPFVFLSTEPVRR